MHFRCINIQFERDSVAKGPRFSKFFLSRDRCVCHKPFHVSIMKFCMEPNFLVYKLISKIIDVKTNVQCIPQLCMFSIAHSHFSVWCGQLSNSSERNLTQSSQGSWKLQMAQRPFTSGLAWSLHMPSLVPEAEDTSCASLVIRFITSKHRSCRLTPSTKGSFKTVLITLTMEN